MCVPLHAERGRPRLGVRGERGPLGLEKGRQAARVTDTRGAFAERTFSITVT